MDKQKSLLKNVLLYSISNFGSKILTFLIFPLYTYHLTTAEFGIYDTTVSIVNMLTPMCILAIHEGLLRWLLKSSEREGDILGTGCGLYLVFTAVLDVILISFFSFWKWEHSTVFICLLTSSTLQTVMQFIARGAQKNKVFAISGIIYTVVVLLLNVLLVVCWSCGVDGMLISMAIAHFLAAMYLIVELRDLFKITPIRFSKSLAHEMLLYSIMLVPNHISWWVMNASDRIMLTWLVGSSMTGIYSLACKFPTVLSIFHSLFYQAWQEQAVKEYESCSRDDYYSKVFNVYARFSVGIILCLIPFSKWFIMRFMNESYKASYVYVGVLFLSTLFYSFSNFYGTGYISAMDTKKAFSSTGVGAIVNIVINLLLMKKIGIWAACISTLVGYVVVWCVRLKQTKKYFSIRVDWKMMCVLIVTIIVYCIVVNYTSIALCLVLVTASCIVCFFINKRLILFAVKNCLNINRYIRKK